MLGVREIWTTTAGARDVVIDAWRGVSILLVILHHAVYFRFSEIFRGFLEVPVVSASFFPHALWMTDYLLVEFSERAGALGVKIFFVISGFIITTLLIREEAGKGHIDVLGFYARRIARILPALLVYAIVASMLGLLGWVALDSQGFWASLGFVCNSELFVCGQTFIHTWTLSVEEQFYIVWPFVFIWVQARYRALFLASTFVALFFLSATDTFIAYGWINNPLSFACIALGALIATDVRVKRFVETRGILTSGALVIAVLVLQSFVGWGEVARQVYWFATPFVIATCIFTTYRIQKYLPRVALRALAALGLVSYSMYLWQQMFLMETYHYLTPILLNLWFLFIPIALVSYTYVEQPAIRFVKRALRASSAHDVGTKHV